MKAQASKRRDSAELVRMERGRESFQFRTGLQTFVHESVEGNSIGTYQEIDTLPRSFVHDLLRPQPGCSLQL
jgi:hypothetical protein